MSIESAGTLPQQLSESLEKLRADLENVQREVGQALGVWRQTLVNEKKEFQTLLEEKESRWLAHDAEGQNRRADYERKIAELADFHKSQTASIEQNALQALNELDDSWQRDKILWSQAAAQRTNELESRTAALAAECKRLAESRAELEEQTMNLSNALAAKDLQAEGMARAQHDEREAYEAKLHALDHSHSETLSNALAAKDLQAEEMARARQDEHEAHEARLQSLDQSHTETLSNALAAKDLQVEEMARARHDEREAYEARLQSLDESHTETLHKLRSAWEAERAKGEASGRELEEAHAVALGELRKSREADKALWHAERSDLAKQLKTLEEQSALAARERERDHEKALEELRAQWEADRSAWKAEQQAASAAEKHYQVQLLESIEAVKHSWEQDKAAWQKSHTQALEQFSAQENSWAEERRKQALIIEHQLDSLAALQGRVKEAEAKSRTPEQLVRTSLDALDNQAALLQEVFDLASRPAHPLRRRGDAVLTDADR